MPRPKRRYVGWQGLRSWSPRKLAGIASVVVVVGVLAWFAVQAMVATRSLQQAADEADRLRAALVSGDDDEAQKSYDELRRLTDRARSNSDGPVWWLAEHTPLVGHNAEAVSTIAAAVDIAATEALPPLMEISSQVGADVFTPRGGAVDLAPIVAVSSGLVEADAALTDALEPVGALETGDLFGRLRQPVEVLQRRLDDAQIAIRAGAQGARVIPAMLGADGPRDYLLLFQTNAEIRSLGGVVGSWAIVHAENGTLDMTEQGGSTDALPLAEPGIPLTAGEADVLNRTVGTDLRNTTLTPDFPRAAQFAREIIRQRRGVEVDGVVSIDPVGLSYLLRGVGPVPLPNGSTIAADNAVQGLLNTAYLVLPEGPVQDEFFEGAAKAVFDAMRSGQGSPSGILNGLGQSVLERRLLVWTADEPVQAILQGTTIAGELTGDDGAVPHVGIYLSDGTATKMEYFLRYRTRVRSVSCADERQVLRSTTLIESTAPDDAASLPSSVTGPGILAPKGSMRVTLRFYAPFGGDIRSVVVDGQEQTVYISAHDGRPVSFVSLQLDPGVQHTVKAEYLTGSGQTADGVFTTTPGIVSTSNDTTIPSACG